MTVKAGQKCTAIRRAMAPAEHLDAVETAIGERLAKTKVGDPREADTRMGALVSLRSATMSARRSPSSKRPARGSSPATRCRFAGHGGAFLSRRPDAHRRPLACEAVHDVEPFGPVSTIMPYKDLGDAIALANRGMRQPGPCRCSPTRPTPRETSSSARGHSTGGCW